MNAYELTYQVARDAGILADLKADKSTEGMARCENIEEVLNGVREFVSAGSGPEEELPGDLSLTGYLQNVSLLTEADIQNEDDRNKVTLMTVHASKGLEFDVVYLAGMEENLFPSQMAMSSAQDVGRGAEAILCGAYQSPPLCLPFLCRFKVSLGDSCVLFPQSIY